MWFPKSLDTIDPATAFMVLAWAELFEEQTPDTYRVKLHNVFSLIVEFGEVAEQAITDSRWNVHLKYVLEELQLVASYDKILPQYYPHIKKAISSIRKEITPNHAVRFANVAKLELSNYKDKVFENVSNSLSGLPKKKEDALNAVQMLATVALQQGLTITECRNIVGESTLSLEPAKVGEKLVDFINQSKKKWKCIIGIEGEDREISKLIHKTSFRQLQRSEKPLGKIGAEFLEKIKNAFRVITVVDAFGVNDAVQTALPPLRLIVDIANFNHRSAPFRLSSYIYLEPEGSKEQRIVPIYGQHYRELQPQKNATDDTASMQKKGILDRLPESVITSLEQYSVAQTSTDPKIRFTNLWIALETLVGHDHNNSIIDNLLYNVVPSIIHRRVNKIIKYLAICLHKFGFDNTATPDLKAWFCNSTVSEVKKDELLLVLTGVAGTQVQADLCKVAVIHPLLCNRLHLVNKTLKGHKELSNDLQSSKQRVEWQLRRIYRIRNLLVHRGKTNTLLPHLVTNLEYYYSIVLSRILYDFDRNEVWSIENSFEYRRIMFDYLMHLLGEEPLKVTVKDVLQTGARGAEHINLGNKSLWIPISIS